MGRRSNTVVSAATILLMAGTGTASAHAPLLSCFDNENGTITCEAGYSDGAPAAGQLIRVREANGRLILESVFDTASAYSFDKPKSPFVVEFIGDPSHVATFDGEDLTDH
jgi:hypothetical protein